MENDKDKQELIFFYPSHGLPRHPSRPSPPHPSPTHKRFPLPTTHRIRTLQQTLQHLPDPTTSHPNLPPRSLRRPPHRPLHPPPRSRPPTNLVLRRTNPLLRLPPMGLFLSQRRHRRNSARSIILQEKSQWREDSTVRPLHRKSADNALSPLPIPPTQPPRNRNRRRNLPR